MTAGMILNSNILDLDTDKIVQEEDCNSDVKKIIKLTSMSLKTITKASYNPDGSLNPADIEQIKMSLANYRHDCLKVNKFQEKLIDDLTDFQDTIKKNYSQKINELVKTKRDMAKQIRVLNYEKNKLIMNRLYKILWPYDKKTQEYTNQINKLTMQVEQYNRKLDELKNNGPVAKEKDILIYQMHLKDKYLKALK